MQQQQGGMEQIQNFGMNVAEAFLSVFCMPLEMILRPRYGSRYFAPIVWGFTALAMIVIPAVANTFSAFSSPIFMAARIHRPEALFSLFSLTKLFFLLSLVHGVRTYRRMFKPELEDNSHYEGPPLFFIYLIPGGKNFWFSRIVLEPSVVVVTATVLQTVFIFQPSLAHYLQFAALCLSMKSLLSWFQCFHFLRDILDAKNAGPKIARFVENTASQEDLNSIHLANLPKDLSPEMRRTAAVHIARTISPGTTIPEPKGDSHDANQ